MRLSFFPATLLSLCFSIGLILPTVTGRSLYPPTSPASPLYRRDAKDFGNVQPQVNDLFRFLSKTKLNQIDLRKNPSAELDKHIKEINKLLPENEPLRILFIEYAGSGGDVGKSMTYTQALRSPDLGSYKRNLFINMLDYFHPKKNNKANIEIKLAVDCNYLKYMPEQDRKAWQSDIKACSANIKSEEANQKAFMDAVNGDEEQKQPGYLKSFQPHVVVQGNAMSGLYKSSPGFWEKFHEPMNQLVKDDQIVRINIRADFKQKAEVLTKIDQYPLEKADVVLVGQPVDFFKGLPSENHQTRIGRPKVGGMSEISSGLGAWLDNNKKVMYLGLGGPQRSRESFKKTSTESLNKFLEAILTNEKYKDKYKAWSFIMFHNARPSDGEKEGLLDNNDRVYHVWFGVSILSIFQHPNVFIAMHHCGRGILDDTIEASIVPICVGTSDFSDDQFEFADEVGKLEMGRGIAQKTEGVWFEKAKEEGYTGVQKEFRGQESLVEMFQGVLGNYRTMKNEVLKFTAGINADTSGDLAFEILLNLKYAQTKRNPKSLTSITTGKKQTGAQSSKAEAGKKGAAAKITLGKKKKKGGA